LLSCACFPKREFKSNATYSSLKHHSKRAASIGVVGSVIVTGDKAIYINIDWTSVTAREHIVVEKQLICETENKPREYS
jgi:hypothetical protein